MPAKPRAHHLISPWMERRRTTRAPEMPKLTPQCMPQSHRTSFLVYGRKTDTAHHHRLQAQQWPVVMYPNTPSAALQPLWIMFRRPILNQTTTQLRPESWTSTSLYPRSQSPTSCIQSPLRQPILLVTQSRAICKTHKILLTARRTLPGSRKLTYCRDSESTGIVVFLTWTR